MGCDPCECCQCGDCTCDPCTCCQCGEGCCGEAKPKTTKTVGKKIMGKGCKCDPCECCKCDPCTCDPCTCCQCGEKPKEVTKKGGCCGSKKPEKVVQKSNDKDCCMTIVKGDLKIEITNGPKMLIVTFCCSCCDACGCLKCENPCTCKYPGIGRCCTGGKCKVNGCF